MLTKEAEQNPLKGCKHYQVYFINISCLPGSDFFCLSSMLYLLQICQNQIQFDW